MVRQIRVKLTHNSSSQDNPQLVYAILWYHREFQRLATFTLNYGLAEIQRNMIAKASAGMLLSLFPIEDTEVPSP
jgi:hypothetical protein